MKRGQAPQGRTSQYIKRTGGRTRGGKVAILELEEQDKHLGNTEVSDITATVLGTDLSKVKESIKNQAMWEINMKQWTYKKTREKRQTTI